MRHGEVSRGQTGHDLAEGVGVGDIASTDFDKTGDVICDADDIGGQCVLERGRQIQRGDVVVNATVGDFCQRDHTVRAHAVGRTVAVSNTVDQCLSLSCSQACCVRQSDRCGAACDSDAVDDRARSGGP